MLNAGAVRIIRGQREDVELLPPATNLHQPMIEDFIEAIRTGDVPTVSGERGRAVAIVEQLIFASRS